MLVEYEAAEASSPGAGGGGDSEIWAVRHLRGQIPLYIKGEPGAAQIRDRLTRCSSFAEVEDVLRGFQALRTAMTACSDGGIGLEGSFSRADI